MLVPKRLGRTLWVSRWRKIQNDLGSWIFKARLGTSSEEASAKHADDGRVIGRFVRRVQIGATAKVGVGWVGSSHSSYLLLTL